MNDDIFNFSEMYQEVCIGKKGLYGDLIADSESSSYYTTNLNPALNTGTEVKEVTKSFVDDLIFDLTTSLVNCNNAYDAASLAIEGTLDRLGIKIIK